MQISVHHNFERRVGIWPCGFDQKDELFCNQRYGDWPIKIDSKSGNKNVWEARMDAAFVQEKISASSEEKPAFNAVDENIKTWWKTKSSDQEWLKIDLEKVYNVNAIQVNFANDIDEIVLPKDATLEGDIPNHRRCIDDRIFYTKWRLDGSLDDKEWFVISD